MCLTTNPQEFDSGMVVRWMKHLLPHDFTVECIKDITNVVADELCRRPMSSLPCATTSSACDDSRFAWKLQSSLVLDTNAAPSLAKPNTGRRAKHYNVEDDVLWFQKKC